MIDHFRTKNLVAPGNPIPSWRAAYRKCKKRATAHVMDNRVTTVDECTRELGIEEDGLDAAITYARWSVAAEYRLLASAGIHVDDISGADLEPFLGRGRMPVLETVTLKELLDYSKQELEMVAWAQGQDDAYGSGRFVMLASVLRQIYQRVHQGRACTSSELTIARDMLSCQDTDR